MGIDNLEIEIKSEVKPKQGASSLSLVSRLRECFSQVDRIVFAILFGSTARGTASENSDVDIAIYLDGNVDIDERIKLICTVAQCLGLPEDKVDLVFLDDQTPLELRYKIFRDGLPILVRNREIFGSYRDKSISMYLDLKVFLRANRYSSTYIARLKARLLGTQG